MQARDLTATHFGRTVTVGGVTGTLRAMWGVGDVVTVELCDGGWPPQWVSVPADTEIPKPIKAAP